MVTIQKSDLGSGPRFPVADPGVRDRGPLPSPILTVQALPSKHFKGLGEKVLQRCGATNSTGVKLFIYTAVNLDHTGYEI